ncbi:hypothetical protein P6B95_01365 [Streptomyces atratus]|uniref:hypothetical protein n=1 Tax=Streptomyces atratus TaxID=1893 RepID=UPI002AC341BD|nr:hypothetical protein [Streptomyces atratus]WPW33766.1 hypothetical protein P6B95_01365 [Streptomyces atratus]
MKEALLHKATPVEPPGSLVTRAPRPRRRLVRFAAPVVACALAVGDVMVVNLADTPGHGTTAVKDGSATGAPEAAQLLDRIALAAAERRAPSTDCNLLPQQPIGKVANTTPGNIPIRSLRGPGSARHEGRWRGHRRFRLGKGCGVSTDHVPDAL